MKSYQKLFDLLLSGVAPEYCLINAIKKSPLDIMKWIALAEYYGSSLQEDVRQLLLSHELTNSGYVVNYLSLEIGEKMKPSLYIKAKALSNKNSRMVCEEVIQDIVRWKTIIQCRDTHANGRYFTDAEEAMDSQWHNLIFPMISHCDFSNVLELAPGHGRNTKYLCKKCQHIHLVDVNQSCLDACRERFGDTIGNCSFSYYVTDGNSLSIMSPPVKTRN